MQTSLSSVENHAASHSTHEADSTDVFGFWLYIMTDCVLFACLFATFAVVYKNTYGGPTMGQITNLPFVLGETLALLFSSFTYGLAILASYRKNKTQVIGLLCLTVLLGLVFISMELSEFRHLVLEGHSWERSAALSAFFTLVGTHGLHVSLGLVWMMLLVFQLFIYGITPFMLKRLTYLGLFWAFLDIVWIFVFTVVYLMGSLFS